MKRVLLSFLVVLLVCQVYAQKNLNEKTNKAHLHLGVSIENEDALVNLNLKRKSNVFPKQSSTVNVVSKVESSKLDKKSQNVKRLRSVGNKLNRNRLNSNINSTATKEKLFSRVGHNVKSVTYSTHRMDSIVGYLNSDGSIIEQTLLTYDSKNQVIQSIESEFEDGVWYKEKAEYTYNASNQGIAAIVYEWDATLKSWILYYKQEVQYDSNGNYILSLISRWNKTTNNWINDEKSELQYDSKGNNTLEVSSEWSASANKWIYYSKYERQFDSKGNTTLEIRSNWDASYNKWIYDRKSETNYDSFGNLIFEASYSWSTTRNDWDGMYDKKMYEYDIDGNQLLNSSYRWNSYINNWEPDYIYAYDSKGNQTISLKTTGSIINDITQYEGYKYEDIRNNAGFLTNRISYYWSNINQAWSKLNRYVYTLDVNNNQTISVRSNWNILTEAWDFKVKNESVYDVNENNTLSTSYTWDTNLNDWSYDYKFEFSYDSNNFESQWIRYNWDKSLSTWTKSYNLINTRDALNNLVLQEIFTWNTVSNGWDLTDRDVFTYDNGYTTDVYTVYDSLTKTWKNDGKWETNYDSAGNQTLYAYYIWNNTTNTWVGSGEKEEKVFDTAGRQTLEATYYWSTNTKAWEGAGIKYEKSFDDAGRQTLDATYNWNSTTKEWEGYRKEEFTFDNIGRETMNARYDWDEFAKNWKGLDKNTSSYHNFTLIDDSFTGEDVIDNIVYYDWDIFSKGWVKEGTVIGFYSEVSTALKNPIQNNVSVYPTLASNNLTVSVSPQLLGSTFSVFDIVGGTVLKGVIANQTSTWDVSQWAKGIYLLKIGNQSQSSLKIIKK